VAVVGKPFPPGDYDVVVVGSGPGGLQTSYDLRRLGVRHAVLSADEAPAGMFQSFPVFERLITWTKQDALTLGEHVLVDRVRDRLELGTREIGEEREPAEDVYELGAAVHVP